jgi:nucleotide-binding universal stress UspA family protein
MKIVVAVDGSDVAHRAVEWTALHAKASGASVIAVHVVEEPYIATTPLSVARMPPLPDEVRDELSHALQHTWCHPLEQAGVEFETVLLDGAVSASIIKLVDDRDADLVVVGRRGRGGFSELLLGSVSHQLSHHLTKPVVIVP